MAHLRTIASNSKLGSPTRGLHAIVKSPVYQNGSPNSKSLSAMDGTALRRVIDRDQSMRTLPCPDPSVFKKKDIELKAHIGRESLFHSRSGFSDFRGFINLAMLILFVNCFRISVENVMHYGVLADLMPLLEGLVPWKITLSRVLFMSLNVYILMAYLIECRASAYYNDAKKPMLCAEILHWTNATCCLVVPCVVIWMYRPPVLGSFVVITQTLVVWMKLVSYLLVNQHYRITRKRIKTPPPSPMVKHKQVHVSGVQIKHRSKAADTTTKTEPSPSISSFDSDYEEIEPEVGSTMTQYPENVTIQNIYYFIGAPTLCYELNFPRTARIRKRFLFRRVGEVVLLSIVMLTLVQQWIAPTVANTMLQYDGSQSLMVLATRTMKLAVPNNIIWLLGFYTYFHSYLNAWAEALRFGDRQFYRDWWNATTVQYFWSNWNIPVHKWMQRHIYRPLRVKGCPKLWAVIAVFSLSAILHEVAISVPLGVIKGYSIAGMFSYVPLAIMTDWLYKNTQMSKVWGNVIVWCSLLIGQPIGIILYTQDYNALFKQIKAVQA
eukprot:m.159234 g.159234  ORF g.159234 m.159234 type:complete len:549 (+) comp31128_c0_seq1:227-1873(+)